MALTTKIKRCLIQDAELIRRWCRNGKSMPLAALIIDSNTPFWIIDRYKSLIPTMFPDIGYDKHTQSYYVIKSIEEEKTVDPNSLDTVLQR